MHARIWVAIGVAALVERRFSTTPPLAFVSVFMSVPISVVLRRFPRLMFGLIVFGVGTGMQVESELGLSPWDVLHQGIARNTPLSIGAAVIVVSGLVLLLWIPLRQPLGVGTIANAITIGIALDATVALHPTPQALWLRWGVLLAGIVLVGFGSGVYIGVRLGPGPRDGLMTGIASRGVAGHSVSIRVARLGIESAALIVGWLLGGTVGLGTIAFALLIGPLVQFFLERFDMGFHETGIIPTPRRL